MRFVVAVFWSEGPSDGYLLRPIVERSLERWLLRRAKGPAELYVHPLAPAPNANGFAEQVRSLLEQARGWAHVLFVHLDADARKTTRVRERKLQPALALAGAAGLAIDSVIAVIPVRETEAWLMVDSEAIKEGMGASSVEEDSPIPSKPRDVELLRDPKAALDDVLARVLGAKLPMQRKRAILESIARKVRLERLDEVPAFCEFSTHLERVMSGPSLMWV